MTRWIPIEPAKFTTHSRAELLCGAGLFLRASSAAMIGLGSFLYYLVAVVAVVLGYRLVWSWIDSCRNRESIENVASLLYPNGWRRDRSYLKVCVIDNPEYYSAHFSTSSHKRTIFFVFLSMLALNSLWGIASTTREDALTQRLFNACDVDKSGALELPEIQCVEDPELKPALIDAIQGASNDGRGGLNPDALRKVLTNEELTPHLSEGRSREEYRTFLGVLGDNAARTYRD